MRIITEYYLVKSKHYFIIILNIMFKFSVKSWIIKRLPKLSDIQINRWIKILVHHNKISKKKKKFKAAIKLWIMRLQAVLASNTYISIWLAYISMYYRPTFLFHLIAWCLGLLAIRDILSGWDVGLSDFRLW